MIITATERLQVYKCQSCGTLVEILRGGDSPLVCCGQPMILLDENVVDASREKHVPLICKMDGGYKVCVGSIAHPMEEKHFIEWIELIADGKVLRQFLQPGDAPEAFFPVIADRVTAREHCNLHGLWKGVHPDDQ